MSDCALALQRLLRLPRLLRSLTAVPRCGAPRLFLAALFFRFLFSLTKTPLLPPPPLCRYRRDEIDSSHYPVFHQMEGVCVFEDEHVEALLRAAGGGEGPFTREERVAAVEADLKENLEGLARKLYGGCFVLLAVNLPFAAPHALLGQPTRACSRCKPCYFSMYCCPPAPTLP